MIVRSSEIVLTYWLTIFLRVILALRRVTVVSWPCDNLMINRKMFCKLSPRFTWKLAAKRLCVCLPVIAGRPSSCGAELPAAEPQGTGTCSDLPDVSLDSIHQGPHGGTVLHVSCGHIRNSFCGFGITGLPWSAQCHSLGSQVLSQLTNDVTSWYFSLFALSSLHYFYIFHIFKFHNTFIVLALENCCKVSSAPSVGS